MHKQGELFTSALIAGTVCGILSGLPFIGLLYILCCAPVVAAGIAASFLLVRSASQAVDYGRAALAGTLAGMIAAPVFWITNLAVVFLSGNTFEDVISESLDRSSAYMEGGREAGKVLVALGAPLLALVMACFLVVLFAPFGLVGGLLGRAIFERRTAPPPNQPAPPSTPLAPPPSEP